MSRYLSIVSVCLFLFSVCDQSSLRACVIGGAESSCIVNRETPLQKGTMNQALAASLGLGPGL